MAEDGIRDELSYIAFISYRHKDLDKKAAIKVQQSIENYVIPKDLRDESGNKKLGKVFRDEDELPTSASLSDSITYALDHSRFLIVICTPDLPLSKWCEQEIRYFLETHDRDHVIAVLADGSPEESFPPQLLNRYSETGEIIENVEPLAANIAGEGHSINRKAYGKEVVRILAVILGCPFDTLWQRERRARANRIARIAAAVSAAMAIFIVVVLNKNAQISRQNMELQKQLSTSRVDLGFGHLENYDVGEALSYGISAVPQGRYKEQYDRRDILLLSKALNAYADKELYTRKIYGQNMKIIDQAVSGDETKIYIADTSGQLRCVSLPEGEIVWTAQLSFDRAFGGSEPEGKIKLAEEKGIVLCRINRSMTALDAYTGETVWNKLWNADEPSADYAFVSLSPDGSKVLALDDRTDRYPEEDHPMVLTVYDSASGSVLAAVGLMDPGMRVYRSSAENFAGAFSEDGRYFALMAGANNGRYGDDEIEGFYYFLFDTEDWSVKYSSFSAEIVSGNIFYGLFFRGDGLLCTRYSLAEKADIVSLLSLSGTESKRVKTANSMSGRYGYAQSVTEDMFIVPAVLCDDYLFVACDRTLLVYNAKSLKLEQNYGYNGRIMDMHWLDRDEMLLELFLGDGTVQQLNYGDPEAKFFEGYRGYFTEPADLAFRYRLSNGSGDTDRFVSIRSSYPGVILLTEAVTDPHGIKLHTYGSSYDTDGRVIYDKSKDLLTVIYKDEDVTGFLYYSGNDMEKLGNAYGEDEVSREIFTKSGSWKEDRFYTIAEDGRLYELKEMSDYYTSAYNQRLNDGRLMSYALSPGWHKQDGTNYPYPVWIDGEIVDASRDEKTGFILKDTSSSYVMTSPEGWILAYGIWGEIGKNGTTKYSENEQFIVFDALNGKRIVAEGLENASYPYAVCASGSGRRFAYMSTEDRVAVYDWAVGKTVFASEDYGHGDISSLSFSEGGNYLIILTKYGKMDIWSVESGQRVFSETAEDINISNLELWCQDDKENGRIYVLYGNRYSKNYCLCIDTDQWTVIMKDSDVYGAYSGRIIANKNSKIIAYPAYTIDDLASWAVDSLNGE